MCLFFTALLEEKLTYTPQERDLCLMHHEFGVELKDGGTEVLTSTLLAYGEDDNERWGGEYHSSMSKTVGLTAVSSSKDYFVIISFQNMTEYSTNLVIIK